MVSHDLRQPLTVALGNAQLLQPALSKAGLAREAKMAEHVVFSAQRMRAMIENLVDSTRLAAGRLELHREPLEPVELVKEFGAHAGSPPTSSGCG